MKTMIYFLYFIKFICIRSELISVVEINRHGARTPANFPNESSKLFFGSKETQLTINGYRQEQILGQFVKSKYISNSNFLKKKYDSKEFQMISSPTQRTIFSAAGFLSGVYPDYVIKMKYDDKKMEVNVDDTIPVADNIMVIKEIPIKVVDPKVDFLFHAHKCLFKGKKLDDYFEGEKFKDIFYISVEEKQNAVTNLNKFLRINIKNSGLNVEKDFKEILKYFNPIYYHFGKSLPTELDRESFITMKKYNLNRWYTSRVHDTKYLKLTASAFLQTILNTFEKSRKSFENKQKYTKYQVYSGHDTIMVNIFSNLLRNDYLKNMVMKAVKDSSTYKFVIPPFASNMFFELHKNEDTGRYFVHIIYNGKYISEGLKDLDSSKITQNKIEYDKFVNLLSQLIDEDYRNLDCSKSKKEYRSSEETKEEYEETEGETKAELENKQKNNLK